MLQGDDIYDLLKDYQTTKENTIIREGILKHLKLDGDSLEKIVNQIKAIEDYEHKVIEIYDKSIDIDWDHPMCHNSLIKQERHFCGCITYQHHIRCLC
ncbi:MAG: hypothetical protein II393_03670 [Cytophagales bacterium]|nr:hypothetical protein [Cytophagales bacterium]